MVARLGRPPVSAYWTAGAKRTVNGRTQFVALSMCSAQGLVVACAGIGWPRKAAVDFEMTAASYNLDRALRQRTPVCIGDGAQVEYDDTSSALIYLLDELQEGRETTARVVDFTMQFKGTGTITEPMLRLGATALEFALGLAQETEML